MFRPSTSHCRIKLLLATALILSVPVYANPTGKLNDTGQTNCYKTDNTVGVCAVDAADNGGRPRQDGRFGRDRAGMAKTGAGAAGFDYSCVLWNGTVDNSTNCATTLAANTTATASGTPATDWACTKDNHTNLIWSLQTVINITWTNATATGAGSPIDTHNTNARCGFNTGWRVPTRRELLSIVHHGKSSDPVIDTAYFPSTSGATWSIDPYAPNTVKAWVVHFFNGMSFSAAKTDTVSLRLVRSGQ